MHKRAIIIAAGEGTRWNNYKGISKHFAVVDGEPILNRTVRLLKENGLDDIHVVGKDSRYKIDGASWYKPTLTPEYGGADKFLSSRDLWLREEGRTIVLYGDCYFTEKAIKTIVDYKDKAWVLFCRPYESYLTGNGAECFAQSFYPEGIPEHEAALYQAVNYFDKGLIDEVGGWEHYGVMIGSTPYQIRRRFFADRIKPITDWTDDFDFPDFYEKFIKLKAEHENGKG